jgi:hypothetical protein
MNRNGEPAIGWFSSPPDFTGCGVVGMDERSLTPLETYKLLRIRREDVFINLVYSMITIVNKLLLCTGTKNDLACIA